VVSISLIVIETERQVGKKGRDNGRSRLEEGRKQRDLTVLSLLAGRDQRDCVRAPISWRGLPTVPDNIWFANANSQRTVWGEGCIPDNLWNYQQRHHQYAVNYTDMWGSATLTIDASCGGGRVAGYHQYQANPQYPDACPFP